MAEQQQQSSSPLPEEITQPGPAPAPLTPEQIAARKLQEQEFAEEIKRIAKEEKEKATKITFDLLSAIHETERHGFAARLVETRLAVDLFDNDSRLAKVFAYGGLFADIKGISEQQAIAQALTKIRMGRSWGMNEADAMQFIYFLNGKPYVATEMIAAKLMDAGWDWDIRWHLNPTSKVCEGCTLYPKRLRADGSGYDYLMERDPADTTGKTLRQVEVSFTKSDADRAFVWENRKQISLSQKWNFISWPYDMYFSRCIGRLKKRHAPNIMRGATPKDEADDFIEEPRVEASHGPAVADLTAHSTGVEDRRRGFPQLSGEDLVKRRITEELTNILEGSPTEQEVERVFTGKATAETIVAEHKWLQEHPEAAPSSREAQSGESPQRPAADNPATRQQQEPAQAEGLTQAAPTINKISEQKAAGCSCSPRNWDPTCPIHPTATDWKAAFTDNWTPEDEAKSGTPARAPESSTRKWEFGRKPK